ncbi:MAG: aromatic amino acid lyase, partial [Candidatus Zixiibacteriota bacterium]
QEDHVCMGGLTAWKLKQVVRNTEIVLAIQLMCAAQALDFRRPLKGGKGTEIAYSIIRKNVSRLIDDRPLYPDIDKLTEVVQSGSIVAAVENEIGELKL